MSTNPMIVHESERLYDGVLRISEALSRCHTAQDLATTLAEQIGTFLQFDHLCLSILNDSPQCLQERVWGKGPVQLPGCPEELPNSEPIDSPNRLTADWDKQQARFNELTKQAGLGSGLSIPITTPHRRLGVLQIIRDTALPFSEDEVGFLRLLARVVAFTLDGSVDLSRAQHQNERLQLLLSLTKRITSNLEFRELLRVIAANIREVMRCDFVSVSLPNVGAGNSRLYALDFPHSKGFITEDYVYTLSEPSKRVLETLKPEIIAQFDRSEVPPDQYERVVVAEGLKSTCLIPLVNRGRALGVLAIARTTQESFSTDDVDFLSQAAGQIAIAIENALAYREISELKDKLAQEKLYLEEEIRSEMSFENIVGSSPSLRNVLELVETVAPSDSTVLLLGETGTGKELIARAIHDRSRRKDRTVVKLNCAAIPTGLLESELFGHEKGAFTGAISQKVGRLELADQGTLFLDEVGDIPIEIQPKLLRALQEREFERLGSTHTRRVNVRLIAATNRDLEKMIRTREFRSDLYYRLNVFPIRIPPLRDRRDDIPLLVSYFVQKFAKQMQKNIETVPAAMMKGLTSWEWPGNIRELENFIERAVILTRGKALEAPLAELHRLTAEEPTATARNSGQEDIARIVKETISALNEGKGERASKQREEIVRALNETKGRVGGADGAAARLGMNRTTLLARIKKFGIDPKQYV